MIAVSPMRPNFLLVMPPVEVAAARLPKLSQATAPTVPRDFGFVFCVSLCFFVVSVLKTPVATAPGSDKKVTNPVATASGSDKKLAKSAGYSPWR